MKIYHVYIVTNFSKTVLYTGMTNNLTRRLLEHYHNRGKPETFAGRYYCYNLIYYEEYSILPAAMSREIEIKKWRREKKEVLINTFNPGWRFLNSGFIEGWDDRAG
ncbi:MAG: GIY-YIG nuclease family protein [Bacteroidetes bacterium]|nr:GIY-YIG nuclease family protein [Bacteroidota bacterium]